PDTSPNRRGDMRGYGAMRLPELDALGLSRDLAAAGTARNGTYVPTTITADERFWRIVGLYIAEGHCSADGRRRRLQWSFHPTDEDDLVNEVISYWRWLGVKTTLSRRETTSAVLLSSRVLAGWWLGTLRLGPDCYTQRIPDLIWDAPE